MPRIIRKGKTQEERIIGLTLSCYGCGTKWEIEEGDRPSSRDTDPQDQRDCDTVRMDCPVCGVEQMAAIPSRSYD